MLHFSCSLGCLLFRVALWLIAASLMFHAALWQPHGCSYFTLGCLLFYVAMWRSLRGLLFHIILWLLAAGLIVSYRLVTACRGAYCFMSSCDCSLLGLLFHVFMWLLAAGFILSCRLVAAHCGAN